MGNKVRDISIKTTHTSYFDDVINIKVLIQIILK